MSVTLFEESDNVQAHGNPAGVPEMRGSRHTATEGVVSFSLLTRLQDKLSHTLFSEHAGLTRLPARMFRTKPTVALSGWHSVRFLGSYVLR